MKKDVLIVFSLLLTVASCKKDYLCECTILTNWSETKDTTSVEFHRTLTVTNNVMATKKEAGQLCAASNASALTTISFTTPTGNITTTTVSTTECVLK